MTSMEWVIRALEPCYDVVYSFRQLVDLCTGDGTMSEIKSHVFDSIFVGINDELDDPQMRNVINFRSMSWMLSDLKNKISITAVNEFLKYQVFDEVVQVIGGNHLLHLLKSGCWFEVMENKAIVQRIGERLDFTVSDPSFVFRPQSRIANKDKQNRPIFEYVVDGKKKKKVITKSKFIERKSLMYSRIFQGKKQLNESESRTQIQVALIKEMDQIFSFASLIRLAQDENFKSIMAKVKKNHERCFFKSLVDKFCPMKSSVTSHDLPQLLKDVQSHENVCELLRRILFFVFPKELFGSCGNRVKMYHSLKLIVVSGCHVQLQEKNLIRNINLLTVPWLTSLPNNLHKKTFEDMAAWICDYFISSLRCYFYVTETKFDKSKLHFYRKETWNRICDLEVTRQVKAKVLDSLTNASQEMYLKYSGFCLSGARFVPKSDSVRMINRLYKPTDSFGIYSRESKALRSLLHLLKNDQKFVISHNKFPDVIRSIKSRENPLDDIYFIRADIKHCYPSIKHDVLMNIIEARMRNLFGTSPSSITIQSYNFLTLEHFKMKRNTEFIVVVNGLPQNVPLVRNMITILGESFHLNAPLEKIKIYIDDAVIKFGSTMYRMKQGIRQGARLSADLCTLYMESFVNECFKSLEVDEDCLLLEADDLIILTESLERAYSYLNTLLNGSEKYNLIINLDKLRVNFLAPNLKDKNISNDITFFSHRFNTFDQELTFDFTPYAEKDIKYSFACNPFISFDKMSKQLIRQLQFTPQVMDRRTNSKEVLIRNLFERIYLQAFRLAAFVLSLKQNRAESSSNGLHNFVVGLIRKVTRLNQSWSSTVPTELDEIEIALTCIFSVRQVWMTEQLKSRKADIILINQMIEYLYTQPGSDHLSKWIEIFEEYPKYPFNQIILS